MPVDERTRHALYEAARMAFGDEQADTLMELLPPVGWADVATKEALIAVERRLDARIDALERRLDARIDALERRLELRIDAGEQRLELQLDRALEQQTVRFLRWSFAMWASGVAVVATIAQLAG